MLTIILIYLGLGVVVGILAGLLGVGGGLIIVPMVVFTLTWQGVPSQHLMHLALGTSLASIIFTSVSSFWAHHKRGAVHWDGGAPDRPGYPGGDLSRFVPGGADVHQSAERRLCRLPLLYGVSDADQQEAQADPGAARTAGHVRRGQRHRGGVGPGGDRRRVAVGTLHGVVQYNGPRRHRHLGGHRLPHCRRRGGGLYRQRAGRCRICRLTPWGMCICRPWPASSPPVSSPPPWASVWPTACRSTSSSGSSPSCSSSWAPRCSSACFKPPGGAAQCGSMTGRAPPGNYFASGCTTPK